MPIDSVTHGEVVIDGKTYYSDMIIWWDSQHEFIAKTHILDLEILEKLLKRKPEAIVVGIGIKGSVKTSPQFTEEAEKKTRLFIDRTENAADIFNGLVLEGKKAVAILHVTL